MKGGDLLEFQTAEGVENENLPVGIPELKHCPAQAVAALPAEHGILGRWCGIRKGQLLVGGIGVAAAALGFFQPGVFADAAQPGVQAAAALEPVDVQKCLVEGLLQQLFCLVGVTGQGE